MAVLICRFSTQITLAGQGNHAFGNLVTTKSMPGFKGNINERFRLKVQIKLCAI